MRLEMEFEHQNNAVSLISPRGIVYKWEAERPVSEAINILNI